MEENLNHVNDMLNAFHFYLSDVEKTFLKLQFNELTNSEFHVIEAIGTNTLTMQEISTKLNITMGSATTSINNLYKKEIISRSKRNNDKRKVFVTLTPNGIKALNFHYNFHKKLIKTITTSLEENEINNFSTTLKKILNSLEKIVEDSKKIELFKAKEKISYTIVENPDSLYNLKIYENVYVIKHNLHTIFLKNQNHEIEVNLNDAHNIRVIKLL